MFWTTPSDPEYDERRTLFNAMAVKRPRLIAGCETPGDVADALALAQREHLPVAVRSGGHSVAGMSTVDDGLVIDVRPLSWVEVDPQRRRARVGAGATWGMFDAAAQEHALATTGGRASTTGVAGFTLGGGSGWLERRFGLACDNLLGADVVTADGRLLRADATHLPDLLWGLKGGGGNFGVVTSLDFSLHPVGPTVLAGLLAWRASAGIEVARAYRDWADAAPEELGSGLLLFTGPAEEVIPPALQGERLLVIAVLWSGDLDEGTAYLEALRALEPELDLVAPRPYTEFQQMIDDPPGFRHYWSADYHDSLSDEALDVLLASGASAPSPLTQQIAFQWGGAVSRVGDAATPLTHREATWVTHPFAVWDDPAADEENVAWVRRFRRDIAPHTNGGVYLNFIGAEGSDRVRQAYGEEKYARLVALKTEYDPRNVFRGNQNIEPLVSA